MCVCVRACVTHAWPCAVLAVNKAMYVEFSADDSVNAGGFEARFSTRETAAPTLAPTVPATPVPVIQEIGGACGKTFFEGSDNGIITGMLLSFYSSLL